MSESTEDFEKQVKTFEKNVIEAIENNPLLSSYKLGSVTLIPKEEELEVEETGLKSYDRAFSAELGEKGLLKNHLTYIKLRRCKVNNQPYPGNRCPWHGYE